jgi:hypothetical protein
LWSIGARRLLTEGTGSDDIFRRFIRACPFVVIASRGQDGLLDLSPKGDPAGFIQVLDDKTLAIPDRLGNGRLDTFENLLFNPEIGIYLEKAGDQSGPSLRSMCCGIIPVWRVQRINHRHDVGSASGQLFRFPRICR